MSQVKKQTLIRTICFMSFFVAINVICSFLTTVLPLLSILLIIFLPLTSAVVEVMCKDRWFPIYAFATIGLSIVVSLHSIDFTIFYIVPSIFTGYIFGLFSKKNFPAMFAIFFATVIQTGLSFAFIPLLQIITGSNLIDTFAKIFGISDRFWFDNLILLFFFLIALIQIILSFIVVKNELEKFGQKSTWKLNQVNFANYSVLGCTILSVVFSFFYTPMMFLFIGVAYYFVVFVVAEQLQTNNTKCLILDGTFVFISMLLYAILNKYIKDEFEFLLMLIPALLISLTSILDSFLKKSKQ